MTEDRPPENATRPRRRSADPPTDPSTRRATRGPNGETRRGSRTAERDPDLAAAELERVREATALLASHRPLEQLLQEFVRHAAAAAGTTMGSIFLLDASGEALVPAATHGLPQPYVDSMQRVPIGGPLGGACGTAVARGEVVVVSDMRTDPLWEPYRHLGPLGLRAVYSVPITSRQGSVLGALAAHFSHPHAPSQEGIERACFYSHLVAVAIENARWMDEARGQRVLAEMGDVLAGSLEYEATLPRVARLAVPTLADWCAIDEINPDGGFRRMAAAHRDPAKEALVLALQRDYPPDPELSPGYPRVLRTGQPEFHPDVAPDRLEAVAHDSQHLEILRSLGFRSYLCVPLAARGRTLGALTLVMDDSGRRYDTEDLELAMDLARRVAQSMDNARLYRELQRADRAKETFLAMLAHELRNPLAPIRNSLEVLRRRPNDTAMVTRALTILDRQVRHMARLTNDLLEVSRVTHGKITLRLERFDLAVLVHQVTDDLRGLFDTAGLILRVDTPQAPVWVTADPTRLSQALGNLLENAAKFTESGGSVTVRVARDAGGRHVTAAVRDSGIGIIPELLPHLWEPFTQADVSLARSQGGLGLGLALVKAIAELHGGEVHASSEGPGRGATFTIRLPLLPASGA